MKAIPLSFASLLSGLCQGRCIPALVAAVAVALLCGQPAQAATRTWDSNTSLTGAQDGGGTWASGGVVFWNGSADVATGSGDIAQFGAGGSLSSVATVNVFTQSIAGLIFGTTTTSGTSYLLASSTSGQVLTLGASGITVNSGAQSIQVGSPSLSLALGAAQTWTNNSSKQFNVGGNIDNGANLLTIAGSGTTAIIGTIGSGATKSGGLTMNGTGQLKLSGSNFYTGATTINSGTLNITGRGVLGSGTGALSTTGTYAGAIVDNAVLLYDSSAAQVLSGVVSGSGSISGTSGSLTLSGVNTYSGGTQISGAQLNVNNANALGTGTLTIGSNATLGNTSGAAVTLATNNAQTWSGDFIFAGPNDLNLGTGAVKITSTRNVVVNSNTLTVGGSITGSGGLTKLGVGTLTLSGSSGYTGVTTIYAGILNITGTLPGSNKLTMYGGTFAYAKADTQSMGLLTINPGASTINNTVATGTLAFSGITRPTASGYGTLNFANTTGVITTGTTTNTNGILGPWATIGTGASTKYAVAGGTAAPITGLTNTAVAPASVTDTTGTANYDVNAAGAFASGSTSFNTLRYTGATGAITGNYTANGLMNVSGNALTLSGSTTIGSARELVVNTASGDMILSGGVANNGGNVSALTKMGVGTLTLSGSSTFTGYTTVSSGTLNITGAFNANNVSNTSQRITVADGASNAAFTITGGTVNGLNASAPSLEVGGRGGTGAGVVVVNSGTLNTADQIWVGTNSSTANFGALLIKGGTVNAGSYLAIGRGSGGTPNSTTATRGELIMTGGALNVSTNGLEIGSWNLNASATNLMSLSGGAVNIVSGWVYVGSSESGVLDVSGGTLNANTFTMAASTGAYGIVNLRGGTLTVGSITSGTIGRSLLNFNGGTLKPSLSGTNFIAVSRVNIFGGGAIIDTNGLNITINQALLAPTTGTIGAGLSTIAVSGGSGYVAPPIVEITGGGGVGATAAAVLDANGNLTGITVTNPGTDYTSAPTVTLFGGGGSGATIGTVALNTGNTSGGLTKSGSGTLVLNAASTYSGGTTLNSGTLSFANVNALGTGALTLGDSTTLQTAVTGTLGNNIILNSGTATIDTPAATGTTAIYPVLSGTISGAGAMVKVNSGTLTLRGNNTYTGPTTISAGKISMAFTSTLGFTGGASGSYGGAIINNGEFSFNSSATQTLSGVISGPGALLQALGVLNLTGNNTYTGNTTVFSGTLNLAGTLGTGGGTYINNLGIFTESPTGMIVGGSPLRVTSGTMALNGLNTYTGTTTVYGGLLTLSGTLGAGGGTAITAFSNFTENNTGVITGTSSLTVNVGSATVLNGVNTYTGMTTLNGGSISLGAVEAPGTSGPLGAPATSANSIVFNGGNLQYTTTNQYDYSGRFSTADNQQYNVDTNGQNVTWATALTSTNGIVTKIGSGALSLTGSNTYNGGTILSAGQINVNNASALGTGPLTILTSSTLGNTSGGAITNINDNLQSWNGDFAFAGPNDLNIGAGMVTLGASRSVTVSSNTLTVGGVITGWGYGLTKLGAGTLTLTGGNTYNGQTTVIAGGLTITGPNGVLGYCAYPISLQGGAFTLDNTGVGGNNTNRIADTQGIALSGGNFVFKGSDQPGTSSTETVGTITQGFGNSALTIAYGGTNAATLTAAGIKHTVGSSTLINGLNLGMSGAASNVGRFKLTTAPTLVGTTAALAAGINAAAKNTKIVPFLLGEATATTGGLGTVTGIANTFLTYNVTTGLRPLNPTDEFTNNAITAGNNTRITAATTAAGTAAINSLIIAGGDLTITDGQTLTNTSGALLFASSNTIKPSLSTGVFNFGSAEALITVNSGFTGTISAPLTGSGGLTKTGNGNLILSATSNNYSGPTAIQSGTLVIGGSGLGSGNVTMGPGTTLSFGSTSTYNGSNTIVLSSTGNNTLDVQAGGSATLNGSTFSGGSSSGILNKTGAGALALYNVTWPPTSGESFNFVGGTLVLGGSTSFLVSGSTNFNVVGGSTLTLQDNAVFDNTVGAATTLNISDGTGNGTLNINGNATLKAGTLYVGASNTGIVNQNGGTVTVTANIKNTGSVASAYNLNGGTLAMSGSSFSTASAFTFNFNGGTFRVLSSGTSAPANARGLVVSGSGAVINTNGFALGFSYPLVSSTTSLGGGLTKLGLGTLTLSGTNTYTGQTTVNGGGLILGGAGGVLALSSSPISLQSGTFTLDNTGGGKNNLDRISDTQAITLANGSFVFQGADQAATNSSETVGAITQGAGSGTITVTFKGTNTATLNAATFLHATGSASALLNGLNLGKNATDTASVARFIASVPTPVGVTAAATTGINSAAKNTRIVTFLVGEATPATGGLGTVTGTANTFLTYNSTTGFRPLNPTDEFVTNAITSGSNNTRITSATTSGSTITINSLILAGGDLTITDGLTLTDFSGALLFASSNTIKPSSASGALSFGVAEAMITVNSAISGTISAPISAANKGLNKSGAGTLTLSAVNSYSGGTFVNAGQLNLIGAGTLGSNTSALSVNGGILDLGGTSQTVGAVSVTGASTIQNGTLAGASYAFNPSSGNTAVVSANLAGSGALTMSGAGTLTFSGSSSYSGGTTISAGTLQIGNSGTTGSLSGNVIDNSVLAFNRSDAALTVSGNISGSGSVMQIGSGTTTLSGNNAYTGATTISGGALNLTGTLAGTAITSAASFTEGSTGVITGTSSLTVTGGTTTLSGANTYTGATTINGGALLATNGGALANTGSLTVNNAGSVLAVTYGGATGFTQPQLTALLAKAVFAPSTALGFDTSSQNVTYGSVLAMGAGLTTLGGNTLTLTAANTYTGPTTVNSGTLALGTGGALANTAITVNSGASFFAAAGTAVGNTATAAGGATLSLSPGGTLDLTDGTLGNFTINQGATASGAILTLAGGALKFDLNDTSSDKLVLNGGSASASVSGSNNGIYVEIPAGITQLTPGSTYVVISATGGGLGSAANYYVINPNLSIGGTLYYVSAAVASGTATTLNVDYGSVEAPIAYFTGTSSNYSWAARDGVTNSTNFSADAAGVYNTYILPGVLTNVFLPANNAANLSTTLDQNFTINSLTFAGASTSGTTGVSIDSGTGASYTLTINAGTLNGNTSGSGITVAVGSGSNTISAGVILGSAQTWTVNSTNPLTVSGTVADAGMSYSLTKAGTGTLILSGSNTYSGDTLINSGTLALGGNQALQNSALDTSGTGSLVLNGGVTTPTFGGLKGSNSLSTVISSGYNNVTSLTLNLVAGGTNTYAFGIADGASTGMSLIKSGAGTQILTGANTYTGATVINSGTLQIGDGNATGTLSTSSVITTNDALIFNRSTNVLQGTDFSGEAISGSGAVIQAGSGNLVLSATNTYTGDTLIASGTLVLDNNQAIQNSVFNTNGHGTMVLSSSSAALAFGGVRGSGNLASEISSGYSNVRVLTLNLGGGRNDYSGAITDGTTGQPLTLIVSGSGLQILSGVNSYTGATVLNSGTLVVNGSIASGTATVNAGATLMVNGSATSELRVSAGGTLGGVGNCTGSLTVANGGTVSPGNSLGTLSVANATLAHGVTLALSLHNDNDSHTGGTAGTDWSKLAVSGVLDLTNVDVGGVTLSLQNKNYNTWDGGVNHTWNSIATFAVISGFAADGSQFQVDASAFGDAAGTWSVVQNGNALDLQYLAVPEPGAWAMLISGFGMLAFGQRMRRSRILGNTSI